MIELNDLLGRFDKVKRIKPDSWQCSCPHHYDKEPSLTVTRTSERYLFKCHADCDTADILQDIGLTWDDISPAKEPPPAWKNGLEAEYRYYDEKDRYLYSKLRYEGKNIRYARVHNNEKRDGKGGSEGTLYNLRNLTRAVRDGYTVYYVEGEKDVETLKKLGLTATTAGGARDWKEEYARYFIGAKVVILPDNDEPGRKLADQVKRDIRTFAHSVKTVNTANTEHGDVTDYIKGGGTKESLLELIAEETAKAAPWIYFTGRKEDKPAINADLLADQILRNNHIITVRKDGSESDLTYWYAGGVYRQISRSRLRTEVKRYIPVGFLSSGVNAAIDNTVKAIMDSPRNKVVRFDDMNANARYINLKNGIYDVNEKKLLPHTPKLLSTIQFNVNYRQPYSPPVKWLGFVRDLCTDEDGEVDRQMVGLVQECVGFALSNYPGHMVKKCACLYSALGDTGKSVLLAVLIRIVGLENVANVSLQMLCDSRWGTSSIYGKRLIANGDQSAHDINDSSNFKQITGGDPVYAEFKGKQGFEFIFNGFMIFACNALPVFEDDKGGHMFRRMILLHCRNNIPPERQNINLKEELYQEADQIFSWAMDGLHRLVNNGWVFTDCAASDALMDDFRGKIDPLYDFISTYCIVTGIEADRVNAQEFWNRYKAYCVFEEVQPMRKRNMRERMEKLGIHYGKVSSYFYKGIIWKNPQGIQQKFPTGDLTGMN